MSSELPNLRLQKTEGGMLELVARSISAHLNEVDQGFRGNKMYFHTMALAAHRRFEAICKASSLSRAEAIALHSLLAGIHKRSGRARFSFDSHFLKTLPNEFNVRGKWVPENLT